MTALQPDNVNVYFNLGGIYAEQNKNNEAIAAYKRYNMLLPNEWNGYKNTADIYYTKLAIYDSSAFYYNKAWQLNKNEKEIIERYGYSLLNQKKIPEAIAMFNNQVAYLPNDPWGRPYIYECPGKHNTSGYDISSTGFDGKEGTEDDITNWQQGK